MKHNAMDVKKKAARNLARLKHRWTQEGGNLRMAEIPPKLEPYMRRVKGYPRTREQNGALYLLRQAEKHHGAAENCVRNGEVPLYRAWVNRPTYLHQAARMLLGGAPARSCYELRDYTTHEVFYFEMATEPLAYEAERLRAENAAKLQRVG